VLTIRRRQSKKSRRCGSSDALARRETSSPECRARGTPSSTEVALPALAGGVPRRRPTEQRGDQDSERQRTPIGHAEVDGAEEEHQQPCRGECGDEEDDESGEQ